MQSVKSRDNKFVSVQEYCTKNPEDLLRIYKMYTSNIYQKVRFQVFPAVTMKNGVFWDVRRVALARTDVSEERSASLMSPR
jgi:hypothetical protein